MKKGKRSLVMILCAAMLLTLGGYQPNARAEGDEVTTVTTADAFETALEAGGTVELGDDFAIDTRRDIVITKPVTLDLKGHTVTKTYGASNHYFIVVNGGALTVKDTTGGGALIASPSNDTASTKYGYGIQLRSNSSLVVESGLIQTSEVAVDIYTIVSNVRVEINGGTIHSTGDSALTLRGDANVEAKMTAGTLKTTSNSPTIYVSGSKAEAARMEITGGELIAQGGMTTAAIVGYNYGDVVFGGSAAITATEAQGATMRGNTSLKVTGGTITVNNSHGGRSAAVVVDANAKGEITGGSITGVNGAAVQAEENGNVTISGGTLTSGGNKAAVVAMDAARVSIGGGTLTGTAAAGAIAKGDDTASVTVTGGKFSSNVEEYVPVGTDVTANGDGTFTVSQKKFTITYMTNAGVEMGTVEYVVGDPTNAFPETSAFGTHFGSFLARARQKGNVYVPQEIWYRDAGFTTPATFPAGQEGERYTVYCKLTVGNISAGSVVNTAGDLSYADPYYTILAKLGLSGQYIVGRNDAYEGGVAVFEKKVGEAWVTVPERYYTDGDGIAWPNVIWFQDVADSGVYRLKYFRYTATDNAGEALYYVDAYDDTNGEYTVQILPAELTVSGVRALDRQCDGTNAVALTGGTLQGNVRGDAVSFALGSGTLADRYAGKDKPVTTAIQLTGPKAGNYTLIQPEGLTATVTCGAVRVEARPATNNRAGNIEYWYCADCGLYYRDEALTQVIAQEETVIPALGTPHVHQVGTQWRYDDANHWHECGCGAIEDLAAHTSDQGRITKAATDAEPGVRTYFCTVCGKALRTKTIPATAATIEVPATGDAYGPWLWALLLLAAGAALVVAGGYRSRRTRG